VIRIVGLDTSQSSTGIARADVEAGPLLPGVVRGSWTGSVGIPPIPRDATLGETWQRLDALASLVEDEIGDPDLVVIEGPAVYAGNAGALTLVGSWWLILDRLFDHRRRACPDVLKIGPTKLKLYTAFNGRADKGDMVKAVRRHYGEAFDLPLDRTVTDVADAIGLVAIGARFLGVPIDLDHPDRARAMEGVGLRPAPKPPKSAGRTARRRTTERTTEHP
jgi:hypothetical protein